MSITGSLWASISQGGQSEMTSFGGYVFVSVENANSVLRISLSDPTQISTFTGFNSSPTGITNDGTYFYVCGYGMTTIVRCDINGNVDNTWSANTGGGLEGLVVSGNYLYAADLTGGVIRQYSLSDGSLINNSWATGVGSFPIGITIIGDYMYVASLTGNSVSRVQIVAGSPPTSGTVNLNWATSITGAFGITPGYNNNSIFVASQGANKIYEYDLNANLLNTIDGLSNQSGTCCGVVVSGNYLYNSNYNVYRYQIPVPPPCFKEGTQILTDRGYVLVQQLVKGDLVKTLNHGFLPIELIGKGSIYNSGNEERIKNRLYKCSKVHYPELTEDLVITGCHSILVSDFVSKEQRQQTQEVLGDIYVTDKKYRLPACVDNRAIPYEEEGDFTIYHIALENEDYFMNYGIYANGLLVETCSKRYLKELSHMTLL